ncbi:CFI-box-CTERM domain-containing protein [Candidatus Nitrosotenuis sp. DW1]|uniref:CFI-box-CTERM domain-containing protein n=1 Tax=Candidatus Nitrosotenuis sp. DW1 TaxID=2259672 RepID=UPI0015C8D112|nr:CFI-box-CTERM domain-containing protein [Candidatus Nitrosotenuis sp. DW1]
MVASAEQVDKENLTYNIQGGTVSAIETDEFFSSLIIMLEAVDDGTLTITLPRDFLDSKMDDIDDDFFVLVEGEEVVFEEMVSITDRTLVIPFVMGTTEIEIIGTQIDASAIIPEPPVQLPPPETIQENEEGAIPQENGGGCLIATATYGSEFTPQVQLLREIRDNAVINTGSGSAFMGAFNNFYYIFSPTVADWERQNSFFKGIVTMAITPMLTTLSLLNYVDIDSEQEMLGYGIGIILLNVGMYFVVPAIIVLKIRKKFN